MSVSFSPSEAKRVVVVGLASCFGCQLQITNMESHLLDVLGQIDLRYWQLASSEPMPEEFDVAVIEGAVTNEESERLVRRIREQADKVISVGACACTAGIPGLASEDFLSRPSQVYSRIPNACGRMLAPRSVDAVIPVDFCVPGCPIEPSEFVDILHRALYGSNKCFRSTTMCTDCKRNETTCFYEDGIMCLGLVTRSGCGAKCVKLGRPCMGCRGLSPEANLDSARQAVAAYGVSVDRFDETLCVFNQTNPAIVRNEEDYR